MFYEIGNQLTMLFKEHLRLIRVFTKAEGLPKKGVMLNNNNTYTIKTILARFKKRFLIYTLIMTIIAELKLKMHHKYFFV